MQDESADAPELPRHSRVDSVAKWAFIVFILLMLAGAVFATAVVMWTEDALGPPSRF